MDEILDSFKRLLDSGVYTDITLVSSEKSYRAHRAVVCMRSPVIARACEFQAMQKTASGDSAQPRNTFDFLDDDPEAVDCLVQYMYSTNYKSHSSGTSDVAADDSVHQEASDSSDESDCGNHSDLPLHVKVYALAEKYDMHHLKKLAVAKFKATISRYWDTDGFLSAAEEAYTSTIQEDRGMRDAVVKAFCDHRELKGDERARSVLSETHLLAYDIFMYSPPDPYKGQFLGPVFA